MRPKADISYCPGMFRCGGPPTWGRSSVIHSISGRGRDWRRSPNRTDACAPHRKEMGGCRRRANHQRRSPWRQCDADRSRRRAMSHAQGVAPHRCKDAPRHSRRQSVARGEAPPGAGQAPLWACCNPPTRCPASGNLALDGVEEADELLRAMALHVAADHGSVEYVHRRE